MKRVWVREQLRRLIESSPPGSLIPSERELSEQLKVSRPTLRAAIEELARDGLLVRHQGRGTFTPTPAESSEPDLAWAGRVEEFTVVPAGPKLGARLGISPATGALLVRRVRITEGLPLAVDRLGLPADLVPGLEPGDFESGSLHRLLQERFGVKVASAVQTAEATVTDEGESASLEVPVHAPALLLERTTRDAGGRVVEYARSVFRGDRHRITTQLRF